MKYLKPNFKYATPLADSKDIAQLPDIEKLAAKANNGDITAQCIIQRLVNSGYLTNL